MIKMGKVPKNAAALWILAVPLFFYLLPLLLGQGWNMVSGPNILNPADTPHVRSAEVPITAEPWGAAVVVPPFEARLSHYLEKGYLPLWNPYQGLGQPFAAQAEGGAFSPLAILRSESEGAGRFLVTYLGFGIGAIFTFLFLTELGITPAVSAWGSASFLLSTSLSFHIARGNIADQNASIPIIFWAVTRLFKQKTLRASFYLSLATAYVWLAGFIQTAMVEVLAAAAFGLLVGYGERKSQVQDRGPALRTVTPAIRESGGALRSLVIGTAVASPFLLLVIEGMGSSIYKNSPALYLKAGNPSFYDLFAFFFPMLFGMPFRNEPLGALSWPVDWSNLFATSSPFILITCLIGVFATRWKDANSARFFKGALTLAVLPILHYLHWIPLTVVNAIPVLGTLNPKHVQSVSAFLFLVPAALVLEQRPRWNYVRLRRVLIGIWLLVVGALANAAFESGQLFPGKIQILSGPPILQLFSLAAISVAIFQPWIRLGEKGLITLFAGVAIGDLSLYLPLGTAENKALLARASAYVFIVTALLLWHNARKFGAGLAACALILTYGWAIVGPVHGLPSLAAARAPLPEFITRLQASPGYRSFGIFPDLSSLAFTQDIGVVGPFAPQSYGAFVDTLGSPSAAKNLDQNSVFMLAGRWNFPLDRYFTNKAVFDWAGVRFLVLDHAFFNDHQRADDLRLATTSPLLQKAYESPYVTVLESKSAMPKAQFFPSVRLLNTREEIIRKIRHDPATILGAPWIAAADLGAKPDEKFLQPQAADVGTAEILQYEPNFVRIRVSNSGPGMLVLKDSYYPGWSADLDGHPVELVPANAIARGLFISEAGDHVIEAYYRPFSFRMGLLLSALGLASLAGLFWSRSTAAPARLLATGTAALTVATFAYMLVLARGRTLGNLETAAFFTLPLTTQVAYDIAQPATENDDAFPFTSGPSFPWLKREGFVLHAGDLTMDYHGRFRFLTKPSSNAPLTGVPEARICIATPAKLALGSAPVISGLGIFARDAWHLLSLQNEGAPGLIRPEGTEYPSEWLCDPSAISQINVVSLGADSIRKLKKRLQLATATQSTILPEGNAQPVRHGEVPKVVLNQFSVRTQSQRDPWWQADLGSAKAIQGVRFWNRSDYCREPIADFAVFVSDQNPGTRTFASLVADTRVRTYLYFGAVPKERVEIALHDAERFVRIQRFGVNDYMSLAEIEILGR